jgi:hypothetical protein
VKGFEGVGGLVSGEDDLLMQKIARGGPHRVAFVTGRETAVHVRAVKNAGEFLAKRTRWASKIKGYPSGAAIVFLSAVFLFFAAVPAGLFALSAGLMGYGSLAAGLSMKMTGDLLLAGSGVLRSGKPLLLLVFLLAEILHIPYILFVTVRGYFGSFEWRGRRTGAYASDREQVIDGKRLD